MGMDPLTIGLITSGVGAGMSAIGGARQQAAQNRQTGRINAQAQGLMLDPNNSFYEAMMQKLIGGNKGPMSLDPTSGNIDIQSIVAAMNPGNDALNQFIRSDPTRQLQAAGGGQFDASQAFQGLQANDFMQINRAANATRAGFAGLGQRFGGAAQRNEGQMRGDFAAQIAARNAGIAQTSFETAKQRALQATTTGLGLQFQGAQGINQNAVNAAQISAGLAQSNQGNLFRNNQFNLDASQQNYMNMLSAIQGGFNMNMAGRNYNRDLLSIMAGLPVGGNALQSAGSGFGDIGQLIAFLPLLQKMGGGK